MFESVTLRVADLAAAERFYTTVLGRCDELQLTAGGGPPTTGLHIGFAVASREAVDAFWRVGVDNGYASDGEPGERPQYTEGYYGGFLLDPDGNSVEAVHHPGVREPGTVDHLWIRVADLAASRRFYLERIAPAAGLRKGTDTAGRVSFNPADGSRGTFSLVADDRPVTTPFTMALAPSGDQDDLEAEDPDGTTVEVKTRPQRG